MGLMGRWEPDSAGRLVQAALALFGERGFDETTAEEIARQAGLTERTFFRYFADKREVLFYGANELKDSLVRLVVEAPASATPIEAVTAALESAGTELQARAASSPSDDKQSSPPTPSCASGSSSSSRTSHRR